MKIIHQGYAIMSKDRKVIAVGIPRNRSLTLVSQLKPGKRILTYKTYNLAKAAFSNGMGFFNGELLEENYWNNPGYDSHHFFEKYLEAVKVNIIIEEV